MTEEVRKFLPCHFSTYSQRIIFLFYQRLQTIIVSGTNIILSLYKLVPFTFLYKK